MIEVAEIIAREIRRGKIVEIGVGFYLEVAKRLRESGIDILVVDINEKAINYARKQGIKGVVDDIFNPTLGIYKDAKAIYSIRPAPEMMKPLLDLARKLKIPLYIVPLTGDRTPNGMKLINYKGIPIYKWEP
ncbi:UPF0146 family protein [Pyrococcus horikoshii]|uniref:UPF0146 protein PH0209 n=2 Tax=Pyrococcus horikoshii TaxID=53953 RepID=Y209_PYRHO|nr:UPF0146 family protein [Pyrococcus horikoshii]O57948.1 RecName: Full=UPF0146 protein PH0209 [Pyrococcus horikoshii OT3]BAA29278.1 131aa long hypothetical protein [Pyrococcus horikoshii OT3]HII61451.1 UPF0146 family protein [Pyrococcus horikoshii]